MSVIMTPKFRAGYMSLPEPKHDTQKNKFIWSVEMIFEPDEDLSEMAKIYLAAYQAKHKIAPPPLKSFQHLCAGFRKGIPDAFETGVVKEGREGKIIAGAARKAKDVDGKPELKFPAPAVYIKTPNGPELVNDSTRQEIYSGAYYVAFVNAYGWFQEGRAGASFGLDSIMKVADGEPLVSRIDSKAGFGQYISAESGFDTVESL